MALRQTLRARPLTANFGLAAAASITATLLYTLYATPTQPPTVFGTFRPRHLRLESVQDLNHNTKRLRFALPNPDDLSGLPLTCTSPPPPTTTTTTTHPPPPQSQALTKKKTPQPPS